MNCASGKERASYADQLEAPESAIAPDDARRLNGMNRQMQPDAAAQRLAASQAAAKKRKANAMPEDERKMKDAERNRLNRARKAAEKAAAAAAARESVAADASEASRAAETTAVPTLHTADPVSLETFNGWCVQFYGEDQLDHNMRCCPTFYDLADDTHLRQLGLHEPSGGDDTSRS